VIIRGLPQSLSRQALSTLALVLALGVLVFGLSRSPGFFVGDSSDYYALYLAWKDTFRPFMTEASWAEYARRQPVEGWHMAVPLEMARHATGGLIVGDTGDFNHFWFYSLVAATIGRVLELVGFRVQIQTAFVVAHWLLLAMACVLARKHFGWKGLAAALLLTLLSPILWFIDKVHTEFFTYALALSAVIVFLRGRYLAAALFLAIASTQNISFGAVALAPLLVDLMSRRSVKYSFAEIRLLAAIAVFLALHPAYYLLRHGAIEPQMLRGGAKFGSQLANAPVWFFDLDIGLFSNWPLGAGLLLLAAWVRLRAGAWVPERKRWLLLVAAYVGLSLLAQSSTTNLNSGGTRSIARYATWYIPLFFPAVLMILEWMRSGSRTFRASVCAVFAAGGAYNANEYRPAQDENSRAPTLLSDWVQTHWPNLYDPPAEIFSERFGGLGESHDLNRALAVVGPDCRKALVFFQAGRSDVLGGSGCGFDGQRLNADIAQLVASSGLRSGAGYVLLDARSLEAARFPCPQKIELGRGGNLPPGAADGFGLPEKGGRWSEGNHASITCWVDLAGSPAPSRVEVTTSAFVHKGHTQRLRVSLNDAPAREFSYQNEWESRKIDLAMPPLASGRLRFDFETPDATSPRRLASSPDPRRLGIWIGTIEFKRP
jgi:hypothetical protein